jgi:nucleotide-binding universal stress UspA family protein
MFEKILIPMDFSPGALKAYQYVLTYLNREDPNITLLYIPKSEHVRQIRKHHSGYADHLESGDYDALFKKVTADASLGRFTVSRVNYDVVEMNGHLEETILSYVHTNDFDLIAMGTHGASLLFRPRIGSTALAILHEAQLPTLIVPIKAELHGVLDRILLAMDFQRFSESVFRRVLNFAQICESELHCVDVNVAHNPLLSEELERLRTVYSNENVRFSIIEANDVLKGLNKYAHQHDIDLVISVTHNMTIAKRVFNKSYTDEMIGKLKLPVLAFKFRDEE